jgi:hypothetical protein
MHVFGDGQQSNIVTAVGGLAAFSSDYANFEAIGVPIMNLFPDMFGPHQDGTPASAEGAATIHTPRDSAQTLNALTSPDQSGLTASDGWMTGMELCANLESRYMLQPEMAGAQTATMDPVAFMEITKPVANKGKLVTFDASGSYQYSGLTSPKSYVNESDLQFKWNFGDGSPEVFGKVVKHAYKTPRDTPYQATLTVTNRDSHAADTATRNVLVKDEGEGNDTDPDQSGDPGLRAKNSVIACQSSSQFRSLKVKASGKGLKFTADIPSGDSAKVEIFRSVKGRRATKPRRVARFSFKGSYKWSGKGARSKGVYFARVSTLGKAARPDVRSFAFTKTRKFKARKTFQRTDTCSLLSLFRLGAPTFGGKQKLLINFTTTKAAKVTVKVLRGSKKVKTLKATTSPNRLGRVVLKPKKLKRGEYKITLTAVAGSEKQSGTLYARKY